MTFSRNDRERPARDELLSPLRVDDAALAQRIRDGFDRFGYNGDAIREEVPEAKESVSRAKLSQEEIARRLAPTRPLACLIRAFLLRAATRQEDLRRELGDAFFDDCEEAGLWERVEDGIVGRVVMIAEQGNYLMSDHSTTRFGEKEKHWVMAIGTTTMRVAHSIEQRRYERVLDLCCGGGVQSFLLASHADQIVAIDRNPRALNFGRFATLMNGLGHIAFRETNCYSAVQDEQFDLIACNPPYVITPDLQSFYRDGGMGGDRFAETVLRGAADRLREGGMMHVLCDVATMTDGTSEERLRAWLRDCGCDVIAIGDSPRSPIAYAQIWLSPDAHVDDVDREIEQNRWVQNLMDIGVEAIVNWLVVLRKRTAGGPNWFHVEGAPKDVKGHFGHQIARLFRCQQLLRDGEEAIWSAKLRLAPDVRLEHVLRPSGGRWAAEAATITFAEGLIQEYGVDVPAAGTLMHFDREPTAEAALERISAEMKTGVEDLRGQLLGFLRHLIGSGVLEPV